MLIGAVAKSSGVGVETIRYYERIGLLASPLRSAGGQRLYDDDHRRSLVFIRRARALGFGIDDIRSLMSLAARRQSCDEARVIAERHRMAIRERLADLRRMDRVLTRAIAACAGADAPDCPVIEALSPDPAPPYPPAGRRSRSPRPASRSASPG